MKIANPLFLPLLALPLLGVAQDEEPLQAVPTVQETWREALTDPDLARREASLDEVVAAAARQPELRAWLQEVAAGDDPGLAWTARVALRDLRRGVRAPAAGVDPFRELFGGWPGLARPRGSFDPFQGWELLRGLEEELDRLRHGGPPLAPDGLHGRSQTYRIQSGPDGVRVEVVEREDGDERTRVYEGDDLEALLDAHPELRETIRLRVPLSAPDTGRVDGLLDRLREELGLSRTLQPDARIAPGDGFSPLERVRPLAPPAAGLRTDRLGVLVRPVSAPGTDEGPGLRVERVVPGSLAALLGVQAGDVLLRLNGVELFESQDVARVLGDREPDAELELEVRDGAGGLRRLRWTPPE